MQATLSFIINYLAPTLLVFVLLWRLGIFSAILYLWDLGELVHHNKIKYSKEYQEFHKSEWYRYDDFGGNIRTLQYDKRVHFKFWLWERLFHTNNIVRRGISSIARVFLLSLIGVIIILSYKFIFKFDILVDFLKTFSGLSLLLILLCIGFVLSISLILFALCVLFAIINTLEVLDGSILRPSYPLLSCYEYAENAMEAKQYDLALKYYNILQGKQGDEEEIYLGFSRVVDRARIIKSIEMAKKLLEEES